ncbi:MAG: hypothetical protein GWQ08_11120 [Verrucomicrobiaceae bacterium]|nr:hypothetical protein [Verrucomicrobiaceae bacterium]
MEFEFLQQARSCRSKRAATWKRFWLAFSCGGLLLIGTVSLINAIRAGNSVQVAGPVSAPADSTPLETFEPPSSDKPLPNVLHERPSDRPIPKAVNEFLRSEQSLNSRRLEILRDYEIGIRQVDFSARCLPQWDFGKADRGIIWFYHYQSGATEAGKLMTCFGAVDGLGSPIFQYPPATGDPLTLLDSQYAALKWVALEKPAVALIVGSNGPWERSGTVTDLFLVNQVTGNRFWRFKNNDFEERPPCSAHLVDFRDVTGDGYRDLCSFWLSGTEDTTEPSGRTYAYDPAAETFTSTAIPIKEAWLAAIHEDFQRIHAGGNLDHPFVLGAPAQVRVFLPESAQEQEPKLVENSPES